PNRQQYPHRPWRAPDRERRERRELPSRRAAIRKLYPLVHSAELRGLGASERRLRQGRAEDQAGQEGRSQAQADQSQRGRREDARSQGSRQGRVKPVASEKYGEAAYIASPLNIGKGCLELRVVGREAQRDPHKYVKLCLRWVARERKQC